MESSGMGVQVKRTKKADPKKWRVILEFTDEQANTLITMVHLKQVVGNFLKGNPVDDVALAVAGALYRAIRKPDKKHSLVKR